MMFDSVPAGAIPRYKRSVKGMNLSMKPELIVKASFESKAKLDGDSRGLCSDILPYGPLDRLAVSGIVPLVPKVRILRTSK